jgi:hypothetical protein
MNADIYSSLLKVWNLLKVRGWVLDFILAL